MTESCAVNYCQDGLQVYFSTERLPTVGQLYGHYELQPNDVNGRPYFKMGSFGLWYNGVDWWWIGLDIEKGQSYGYAYYETRLFCPHQFSGLSWMYFDGNHFVQGEDDLIITCKWIFSKTNP